MAQLVVGGVTIPVAPGNAGRDRDDFTDRRRAFDGTYRASQTGGAARTWHFRTPPITRVLADTYEATLGIVAAQMCSGDLLGIPTMCCAQIDSGWNAIKAASGHYVELPFTLHEVQPAKLLLKYAPGDTITGETFSRSTVGYQINAAGVLVSKAINAKRDGHFIGGVQSLLLEETRTNNLIRASEFSNAAWVKTACTVGTGIADPAGGTAACTLTATGVFANATQTPATGTNVVRTNTMWIKRRTGSGTISLLNPPGNTWTAVSVTGAWQRFPNVGAVNTGKVCGVQLDVSGDEIDVFIGQDEDGGFQSSEIQTTTAALARGADSYSLPFTFSPAEMTAYVKFVEKGTLLSAATVIDIDAATAAVPLFRIDAPSGFYRALHFNAAAVSSSLAVAPSIGDTVELLARLFGDGSVDITQTINGGAATSGAQSAATPFGSAWSGQLCFLNSAGSATAIGFNAFQSVKIVAGMRSLVDMRAA